MFADLKQITIFSINSINVHILLDKRQLGLVLIFNDKGNGIIHQVEECSS